MKKKIEIDFHYDREVDVLYASIGKPRPATSIEKGNGILLRIDPKTNDIIGFTVIKYMKRKKDGFLKHIPEFENIELPIY